MGRGVDWAVPVRPSREALTPKSKSGLTVKPFGAGHPQTQGPMKKRPVVWFSWHGFDKHTFTD